MQIQLFYYFEKETVENAYILNYSETNIKNKQETKNISYLRPDRI